MKALFAITYSSADLARDALKKLAELQKGQVISVVDAVIVTRTADGAVKLDQSLNTTAVGAMSGALWGSLIGLIFLNPLIGAAVGAAAGAASGYATDYGISDEFMTSMGQKMAGGRAGLFVLANDISVEKVAAALGSPAADVLYTSMPEDIESRFRARLVQDGASMVHGETTYPAISDKQAAD